MRLDPGTRASSTGATSIVRSVVLGVLTSLSIVACGSRDATSDTATAETASVDESAPGVLQFTAPLVGGGRFDGAAIEGRPVAFWFWAPT